MFEGTLKLYFLHFEGNCRDYVALQPDVIFSS